MQQPTVEHTGPLIIWTYDWVPEMPRGHVRDIRLRWALEEAGLFATACWESPSMTSIL